MLRYAVLYRGGSSVYYRCGAELDVDGASDGAGARLGTGAIVGIAGPGVTVTPSETVSHGDEAHPHGDDDA